MFLTTFSGMEAHSMAGYIVLLILGIILVVKGGDWFVDAASWMAEVSGIPTFLIGATIVSVATTLPEILVSSIAAAGSPEGAGMAIGNAVGSVNCNIALIMGISLLFMPSALNRKDYAAKIAMLLAAVILIWVTSVFGKSIVWWEALIIFAVFAAFMVENVLSAKKHTKSILQPVEKPSCVEAIASGAPENLKAYDAACDSDATSGSGVLKYYKDKLDSRKITLKKSGKVIERKDIAKNIILFIVGAAAIVVGAQLMCDNGSAIARELKVSQELIGVTILAVGTSLPELVTAITAIIKKKSDLSVGNIIGANIIDLALIMPLCAFISAAKFGVPLAVVPQNLVLDFPFCLAVVGFALIPAFIFGKFKRWQGALLVAGYVTYITLLVLNTLNIVQIFN